MSSRAAVRSRSAPPNRSDITRTLDEDNVETFPTLLGEDEVVVDAPLWLRELSTLRSGRHSRASSIVSTRTKFSTTTLDEVRSIEFSAGNQTFRISRDGSKVTDTTAPPPYSGPFWDHERDDDVENDSNDGDIDDLNFATDHEELDRDETAEQSAHEAVQEESPPKSRGKRVRIVMPDEEDDDNNDSRGRESPTSASRVLTKADLYQLMWDLPLQLKRVLGLRRISQSQSSLLNAASKDEQQRRNKERPTSSQSLPDSFQLGGSGEVDFRPLEQIEKSQDTAPESSTSEISDGILQSGADAADLRYPLTVTDLNELSSLYNRVIKDLDREHRKQLHERDKEMAQLRFLLNEKDIVYRQQLKGKDFVIDDLRKKLEHNEDVREAQVEQARHEVEDLWEKRWKERERHLLDHIRRMEDTVQAEESKRQPQA